MSLTDPYRRPAVVAVPAKAVEEVCDANPKLRQHPANAALERETSVKKRRPKFRF
jgi:hypothetical protein